MEIGLFVMPLHPPDKPLSQSLAEDTELVVRADELGYHEAWIGHHISLSWQPIAASDIYIASLVPVTKRIRLGPGVALVPQHHPVNLASRLALLDHLSGGRLICGFGRGGVATDFELFALPDFETQERMMVEGIDTILRLWEVDPPFEMDGSFWRIRMAHPRPDLGLGKLLRPLQQPHPPLALAAFGTGSKSAHLAGRRNYLLLSSSLCSVRVLRSHWQAYLEGSREAGFAAADRASWRIARYVFVGRTRQDAWRMARNGSIRRSCDYLISFLAASRRLGCLKNDPAEPSSEITSDYLLRELCIIGDPDDCIDQLARLWAATGGFGTLLAAALDCEDRKWYADSLERLARQVVPALAAALTST